MANRVTLNNDGRGKAAQLKRRKVAHRISYTANTTRITTADTVYTCTLNPIPLKWLRFIKEVKDYALSLDPEQYPQVKHNPGNVSYFRYNQIAQREYYNVREIDVNGAYWQIAHQIGYINNEIYQTGLTAPKMVRLVALGALATRRKTFDYDPQADKYNYIEEEHGDDSNRVRSYFFDIAATLGRIMTTVADAYTGVLFFWVDAFFTDAKHTGGIVSALRAHDLEVKFKEIEKIIVKDLPHGGRRVFCHMEERDFMGDQIVKPFTIPGPKNIEHHLAKHRAIIDGVG